MKKISAKSKLGQHFVEAYYRSTWHTLKDVYAKPSTAKQAAFEHCQRICKAENGRRLRIISANIQAFTVAFEVTTALGATELHVISRRYDYIIYFGDNQERQVS